MNKKKLKIYAIMQRKKIYSITFYIMVICGLYGLSMFFNLHEIISPKTKPNEEHSNNKTLATHLPIPWIARGRILPFHHIYEARKIGFPTDLNRMKITSNATKLILLWTPWNGIQSTINYYSLKPGSESFESYNCPNQKCVTTRNRNHLLKADVVLFHLLDIKASDLPPSRTSKQLWILYNLEAPWLIKKMSPELQKWKNLFNWTMTYRSDSNVVARYGFIAPKEESSAEFATSSAEFEHKTKNIAWFVSDCKTDSKREAYVEELKKYIDIDVYGRCGDKKCYPAQSSTCYEEVLNKYKFYLSFENSLCKDYVTEKFFNVFNYDIIPIVFGAANYSAIAPEGTFIDATKYPEPKLLASTLLYISNNKEVYNKILLKKRSFEAYLDPWMCRLCSALHTDTIKPAVLGNIEKWWLQDAQCKTWDNINFKFVDSK